MPTLLRFAGLAALLMTVASQADAEDRSVLVNCKAVVERAAQAKDAATTTASELARCRQIIREWALRDARMTVDEQGRPLR